MNGSRTGHALALFSTFAVCLLGLIVASSIPSAVFPELVFPRAIILADSGDLPPEQMQVTVTRPLEEAAYGVIGVSLVRSTTTRGSAEVDVTFSPHADPTTSFQLLNAALGEVRSRFPPETQIDSRLLTTGTFPIIDVSLSSHKRSLPELTDIAFYDVVPSFHRIPGVYRVEMVGGKYREYVARLDPARMLAHNLSPQEVVTGLAAANVIASPGRVMDSHRMMLAVVTSDLHTLEQLEAVPVATVSGQPVHVRDIGSVEMGIQEDYIRAASGQGEAVLVGISRQPDGNTDLIAAQARALIENFRSRYPDVTFSVSYDQSALVDESFNSVRDAIGLGLLLAALVVYLFTRSALNALIAAIVVPTCILATFLVMRAAGLTFNMMTLGGLAAGIGLFIDDAIVMIEGIHRQRVGGQSEGAVARSLAELRRPLLASTLTVIVVFAPLVFMTGVTGTFFRALATTLGAGLAISLLLALYVTPALELMLERWRRPGRQPSPFSESIRHRYERIVEGLARRPILTLASVGGGLVLAFALYRAVGTDYLPPLDEGAFILDYATPPPSTLDDTQALLEKIQSILKSTPEVVAFSRRTGTQLGFFLTESNKGDISVRLSSQRSRSIEEIMDSVRKRILASVPGVRIEFSQILQDLIGDLSGMPEPIEVKVFGPDQATIEGTARKIAAEMSQIHGLVDVFDGIVLSNPEQEILVDETAASRYHLSAEEVRGVLQTVVAGTVATNLRAGDRLIGVRVRYPTLFHRDLDALPGVLLKTADEARVPLAAVTTQRWLGERAELDRERLRAVVHATSRLSNLDLGTAIAELEGRLAKLVLPAGVTLEFGGLYAQQQEAFRELTLVLVAATVSVFLILLWEFAAIGPALAVLFGALPALAGSFIGLASTGVTLNISSFMGMIMVVGIAAKNGILLLDHAEREVAEGVAPIAALIRAAQIRIRPILMTTLATAAGLLPLALGFGAGAKVQQPLAIVVIGGLAFSMLLAIPLTGGLYLLGPRRQPLPE